jgi:hypothetical protein
MMLTPRKLADLAVFTFDKLEIALPLEDEYNIKMGDLRRYEMAKAIDIIRDDVQYNLEVG